MVYKRIPGYKNHNVLTPFSSEVKEKIFKKDNYKCVLCRNGKLNFLFNPASDNATMHV